MASVDEAGSSKQGIAADLKEGIDTLSLNQEITFTKYVKLILPFDGFVFWVRSDLVSAAAVFNAARFNAATYNEMPRPIAQAHQFSAMGSLHYETMEQQNEDELIAVSRVVFTSEREINDFDEVGPNIMFIGEFEEIKFAFSQRRSFYQQADTFHYVGNAVYPIMETQLVDSIAAFDTLDVVVSNSLPLWLALNSYVTPLTVLPSYIGGFIIGQSPIEGAKNPFPDRFLPIPLPLYPSFAIPDNLPPPYASVHVVPESTDAIQAAPYLDNKLSHWQLVQERVRITIYGLRNFNVLSFVDAINQYTLDTDRLGIMNMPTVRDDKRTQVELGVLAMKKTIEYQVNYYQTTARDVARQLIKSCIPSFYFGDDPIPVNPIPQE